MKNKQQEQAKNLYFQGGMSKTEIANKIGVNRRTILRWCKEDNWEKLKRSSRHLPALVAEKCYYLIDVFTSRLLQDPSLGAITLKDAQTIHLLATSIKKLKNRSTTNESMEMFNFFLEGLKKKNTKLAAAILPEIEEYIAARCGHDTNDFLLEGFSENGMLEYPDEENEEQYADSNDLEALQKEIQNTNNYDHALENWQNAGTHKNPGTDDNNVETNCMCLPETQENNENITETANCKLPTANCDKNGTFSTRKQLVINELANTKKNPGKVTFHTNLATAHDL